MKRSVSRKAAPVSPRNELFVHFNLPVCPCLDGKRSALVVSVEKRHVQPSEWERNLGKSDLTLTDQVDVLEDIHFEVGTFIIFEHLESCAGRKSQVKSLTRGTIHGL